ncbi:rhodanese-like domain-containing protein [Flavivirga jejuensis]|uniref:Rhodanese-like domain-containing protein n=1 Tax=Flavivirga jejuensis TaxID=870487 RepID=A0ABT8WJR7_9FLAO|nr:rhodanese-like domain-containing protein [Flavivirga jejuensis]MDO5973409.1 rhodanese-like domain-containing protein [Flavivirga jejuensis]
MKRLLIFLCSLCTLGTINCKESPYKGTKKVVSPQVAQTLLIENSIQLVDVRAPKEFKQGHIDGSQNINYLSEAAFNSGIKNLDKTIPIILYCRSGKRSAKSAQKLLKAGFMEVYDLRGGILRWKEEGFETKI